MTNPPHRDVQNLRNRTMKLPALLLVSLSVAAFQSALSASLNSAGEDDAARQDGLTELQKLDQMEFEAAQRNEAAHKNATEEQKEAGGHRAEDQTDAEGDNKEHRSGNSNAPEDSRSSEESDEMTVDSTKDQDGQCSTRGPSVGVGNGHVDTGSHGDQQ